MFLAQEVPDDVLARFAQYVIDFLSFPFTFHEGVISWLLPSRFAALGQGVVIT